MTPPSPLLTPPSQAFKEFERAAWESKAYRYDNTWGKVSIQAIDAVLERARIGPGAALLDLGCGPGHLCAAALRRGCKAIGVDLSDSMLRIARDRYPEIEFRQEDAEQISFPDASFDAVTLNFLLLHVPDQERCLREAARLVKPGGRLVFSIWQPPGASEGLQIMFSAVKEFADPTVIPPAQDIFMFTDWTRCQSFFQAAGFDPPEFEELPSSWSVATAEEFFNAVQAGTRIGGMIDLQRAEVKERIRERSIAAVERFKQGDRYLIPTPALLVSASRAR